MKKIVFILWALVLMGISQVNVKAVDLPFVPDGGETVSQTENPVQTEPVSAEADSSSSQDSIEEKLPVEGVDESKIIIVDESITADDERTVTVNSKNQLVTYDKIGNEVVLDNSHNYILTVNENGQTVISDEQGNFVSVKNGNVTYTDKDGKHITKNINGNIITDISEKETSQKSSSAKTVNSLWKYICIGMIVFIIVGSIAIFMIKRKRRG